MKVAVTGASGYFAWEFIRQLSVQGDTEIVAVSSNPEKTGKQLSFPGVELVSNEEVLGGAYSLQGVEFLVHGAFCRKSDGGALIDSLNYLRQIVLLAMDAGVRGFVNLSSQSVYGSFPGERPAENGRMAPGYLYALAKCASELTVEHTIRDRHGAMAYTNVRLASLMGPSSTVPNNVLCKFIRSSLDGQPFQVVGGKQQFSFLDVRDAAKAVRLLLSRPAGEWSTAYNLGPERQTNILDMAELVCRQVCEVTGKRPVYQFTPDDTQLNAGMDSSLLYSDLHWRPEYSFADTVKDTVRFLLGEYK